MAGSLKAAAVWMTAVGKEMGGGLSFTEGPAQTGNPHLPVGPDTVLVRLLRKTRSQPASRNKVLGPRAALDRLGGER